MIKEGKITLKNHKTPQDEEKTLRSKALASVEERNRYEQANQFEMVKISKGYIMKRVK